MRNQKRVTFLRVASTIVIDDSRCMSNAEHAEPLATPAPAQSAELKRLRKLLASAEAKSARAAEARRNLTAGSTRARVTSANAKWMRAAEHRDLLLKQVAELEAVHS